MEWVNIFFPPSNHFSFEIKRIYFSLSILVSFKFNEIFTHVFKKKIECLNHYDCCCIKVIKRNSNMGCQTNKHSQIRTSLFKIQPSEVFWFKNDLSLVNNKNTPKQHPQKKRKMDNNQNMRSNRTDVEKACYKH